MQTVPPLTDHARVRLAQRGIRPEAVALALRWGRHRYSHGDRLFFLARRDLPGGLGHELARRAEGTVVVVTPTGAIRTVFRNPRFWSRFKKRRNP